MDNTANKISEEIALRMERSSKPVPIGVSNRHIHLTKEDFKALCGQDAEPTVYRKLGQPGQFAANEVFTVETEKGSFKNVRLIGPYRSHSQVEISFGDAVKLGLTPPVRDSGKLDNTPGIKVTGPKGSVILKDGVIVAKRHIHFTPEEAKQFKVSDGQLVRVRCAEGKDRETVFEQVLCRVHVNFKLEFHIDIDEANAAMVKSGETAHIV